jgi:integrase
LAYLDNHEDIERIASRLVAPLDDIWRVMCGTGIEPSPALLLPVDKAEVLATPVLHAHGTKSASRKRNAEYGDRTGQAVERARADAVRNGRPTLFPSHDEKGRRITRHRLAKDIRRASDALVVDHPQFAGIHLYSARHTFAVMAIKGGASYQEVAQQLGHTTVAMVIRRYGRYKSAPGRIAAAMNAHAAPDVNGSFAIGMEDVKRKQGMNWL